MPGFLQSRNAQIQNGAVDPKAPKGQGTAKTRCPGQAGNGVGGEQEAATEAKVGGIERPIAAGVALVRDTPLHPQVAAEGGGSLHDAGFDQDLLLRSVEQDDQLADFGDGIGDVGDDQLLVALVLGDLAPLGEHFFGGCGHVAQVGITDGNDFGIQGFQFIPGPGGGHFRLIHGPQLLLRHDARHIALADHAEAFDFHDQVKGLVPGDIDQAQSHGTLDVIPGDDIEITDLADQLENFSGIRIIEYQRNFFPVIPS